MTSRPFLIGLDVSTTATKAILLDEQAEVVAVASSTYGLETPKPLWAEQDPELWWRATLEVLAKVLEKLDGESDRVVALGLTGQMHGLVLLDEKGDVIRPAILWNDQRSAEQCDAIRERLGLEELVRLTGNDAFPGFTAPKLLWVRDHEPEIYARIRHVLLPKDYVRYRLTGTLATDRAGAGGTLLLDLERRDWSAKMLEAFDIPSSWLPPTHEGTQSTGTLDAEIAERLNPRASSDGPLSAKTSVVGGGGDQAAQGVGVGAVRSGVVAITLGTSGVVFASSPKPLVEENGGLHAFPHAVPDMWHVMGVMLSAAGSLQWYRDQVAPDLPFHELVAEAKSVPRGSDGLLFLPYLSGERTPHADPAARAAFIGLTLAHKRAHMTRAVLEGVAFGLADNLSLMTRVGLPNIQQIRISGGGAKSDLWCQILADVLEVELIRIQASEGAAFGAALLAGVGAEIWPTVEEAADIGVRLGESIHPDEAGVLAYRPLYRRFREAFPQVRPVME